MTRTLLLHCPVHVLKSEQLIANLQIREFVIVMFNYFILFFASFYVVRFAHIFFCGAIATESGLRPIFVALRLTTFPIYTFNNCVQ